MIKSIFFIFVVFLFTQNSEANKQSKLEKDLQLNPGDYELVDKDPNDRDCRPTTVEIYGEGKKEFLYLGPRLLIGDINQGKKKETEFDGCKMQTKSESSRVGPDTGLITVNAVAKCPWGKYTESTQIKVKSSTIEYSFNRASENEDEQPSFKTWCQFKKVDHLITSSPDDSPPEE